MVEKLEKQVLFKKTGNDLKKYAYENATDLHELQKILNNYGIFFVCEKAIKGTKVRGCF